MVILILATIVVVAVAGCTSGAPDQQSTKAQDSYAEAYSQGMDHHSAGQDFFNDGTTAWENSQLREAIADYANASTEYGAAANSYDAMRKYAADSQEKEFAASLKACAYNLSLASDDFMNAAVELQANNTGNALAKFDDGQTKIDASDIALNRSIDLIPGWLSNYTSG